MNSPVLLISELLLWTIVILLTVVTFVLVRQVGLIHRRIPPTGARILGVGPDLGAEAPEIEAPNVNGGEVRLGADRGRQSLLVFISTRCTTCDEIAPAIRSIWRSDSRNLDIILVTDNPPKAVRMFAERHKLTHVPTVASAELVQAYRVNSTPYAILVDEEGRVLTKGIVNNLEHLASMVRAGELNVDSHESLLEMSLPVADGSHSHDHTHSTDMATRAAP